MDVRAAEEHEIEQLAGIWFDGLERRSCAPVPAELVRHRTLERFRERLLAAFPTSGSSARPVRPLAFAIVKDDELYQLYVSATSRGTGVAATLIDDAEARLAASGVETAWLACAIGNDRAARFYEKRGWHRVATVVYPAETSSGQFPLDVWRYEKSLRCPS